MSDVEAEKREEITFASINRPEARNAVDEPTAALLADTFREFDADAEQKVASLTGADGTSCAYSLAMQMIEQRK